MNAFLEILQIAFCIKDPYEIDEYNAVTAFKTDEELVGATAKLLDISEENVVQNAGDSYSRYFATRDGEGNILSERTLTPTARAAIRERFKVAMDNNPSDTPSERDYLLQA